MTMHFERTGDELEKTGETVELEGPAVLQFSSSPVPLTGGTGVEKSGPGRGTGENWNWSGGRGGDERREESV
jgi:hypothetical protein